MREGGESQLSLKVVARWYSEGILARLASFVVLNLFFTHHKHFIHLSAIAIVFSPAESALTARGADEVRNAS